MIKKRTFTYTSLVLAAFLFLAGLTYFMFTSLSNSIFALSPRLNAGGKFLEKKAGPGEEVSIIAVGDIMLARKIEKNMGMYGMDYPFLNVKAKLKNGDITFGNLECAVSDRGEKMPEKGIWFRADPAVTGELKKCGFDILSIANNHSLDYGIDAFLDTQKHLLDAGIIPVGGGANIEEARKPQIFELNDIRIGFLAYTEMADIIWSYEHPMKLKATETKPGVAPFDPEIIVSDIKALSEKVDIVVVSLHWGTEYAYGPSQAQRQLAHQFVDEGADIILGHHPHVVQGVEVYKQGIIAYSMGNFIFDQNWSKNTREGFVLEAVVNKLGIIEIKLYPVIIHDTQPKFAQDEWARNLARDLQRYSMDLGTELDILQNPLMLKTSVF